MKSKQHTIVLALVIVFALQFSPSYAQPTFPKASFVNAKISATGELEITASKTSSAEDFAFLAGKWNMHHQKLKTRFNNSTEWEEFDSSDENFGSMLSGLGNTDLLKATLDGKPFEGFTLRLFNPKTRLWSLYWVASNTGVLVRLKETSDCSIAEILFKASRLS